MLKIPQNIEKQKSGKYGKRSTCTKPGKQLKEYVENAYKMAEENKTDWKICRWGKGVENEGM